MKRMISSASWLLVLVLLIPTIAEAAPQPLPPATGATLSSPSSGVSDPAPLGILAQTVVTHTVYMPVVFQSYCFIPDPITPNDSEYGRQWALEKIDAPHAWPLSKGSGVLVAVLDSGVDLDHPDLDGKVRTDIDYDYINGDDVAQDDNGHGTHVAGIIAAETDNAQGVAGLGWETQIVPYKVLDNDGNGTTSGIVDAIYAATDAGAKVINMSLGSAPGAGPCSNFTTLQAAIDYAYDHGVLVVVAAGNDSDDASTVVPANCAHVLTVSSTDSDDSLSSFSNTGSVIDVSAPGGFIYSTVLDDSYTYMSGTSMATPYVAGLAALVFAAHPAYTPDQVASAILDRAVDLGLPGWDDHFGCGRIDAFEAVAAGAAGAVPQCHTTALSAAGAASPSFAAAALAAPSTDLPHRAGILIVKWRSGMLAASSLVRAYGLEPIRHLPDGSWMMRVHLGSEESIAHRLLRDGLAEYVTFDYILSAK